jgi:hypothetical protein
MNSPEGRGLSLESFLASDKLIKIKPVQRICKYPLLIREMERNSQKANATKDLENLAKAAIDIGAVVTSVNEATRAAEEKQRIVDIEKTIVSEDVFFS